MEILAFLAIWWKPIFMAIILTVLFVFIHLNAKADERWQNLPETIKARQKADYERAHAYKPEQDDQCQSK